MKQDHTMTPGVLATRAMKDQERPVRPAQLHAVGEDERVKEAYIMLEQALAEAYHQAAYGKGDERHANNLPFHRQPMQSSADLHGVGFITGQVSKKLSEAQGMATRGDVKAALKEILGAIVYAAGAHVYYSKKLNNQE